MARWRMLTSNSPEAANMTALDALTRHILPTDGAQSKLSTLQPHLLPECSPTSETHRSSSRNIEPRYVAIRFRPCCFA